MQVVRLSPSPSLLRKASTDAQTCLLQQDPCKPWVMAPLSLWPAVAVGMMHARRDRVMVRVVRVHVFKKLPCASATAGPVWCRCEGRRQLFFPPYASYTSLSRHFRIVKQNQHVHDRLCTRRQGLCHFWKRHCCTRDSLGAAIVGGRA